ncbi:MAG: signal recognition particle-docking protein FtsY [Planctomycetota bacterium]|jgi:fused signal recognition particle receptor
MIFGLFKKSYKALKTGLSKTKKLFRRIFKGSISEERLDELEEIMLKSDMGPRTVLEIVDHLRDAYANAEIKEMSEVQAYLRERLIRELTETDNSLNVAEKPPTVIMVAGVNGSGKTTTIAKLAHHFRKNLGQTVLLAASDTFRAAACEQLDIWAKRVGVDIVKHKSGADPAAVCFDAADAALARGTDILIVDTAGRLHTQTNLMKELNKIRRVLEKKIPGSPHEVLLVLDATVGQNGLVQAKEFSDAIKVSGLVLAKLDGTAKGGVVVAIKRELDIPVKLVGIGEKAEDLQPFDADDFVNALLDVDEE